jgi:hypothetical protein
MNTISSCSSFALQSFPIKILTQPTLDLYFSVLEPLSFEFQWATRTTAPVFLGAQNGMLSEDKNSSVRYNGITYTLESVQLTDPTHKGWILPARLQQSNFEDIILTFSHNTLENSKGDYLVFVIPIIRNFSNVTESNYLTSIGTTGAAQSISLKSVIPSDPNSLFAYYSTCVPAKAVGLSSQNVLNIIAVGGLPMIDVSMARIKKVFTSISLNTTYGGYVPPLSITYPNTSTTLSSAVQFTQYINTTQNILVPPTAGVGPIQGPIEDSTDAYKCVPFDPDNQIVDGKITINPNTGTILTQVQAERNALVKAGKPVSGPPPEVYAKYASTALAFFFSLILVVILVYVFVGRAVGPHTLGHGAGYFQKYSTTINNMPTYLIIGLLCGFVGFMVGVVLKYRS